MRALFAAVAVVATIGATPMLQAFAPKPTLETQATTPPVRVVLQGTLQLPDGGPRTGAVVLVVSLYTEQTDGVLLWSEDHPVVLGADGSYSVLAGATVEGGIPKEHFQSGEGRWLGVAVLGEAEQPRQPFVSVAYAAKAVEADQLAGRALSEFVLQEQLTEAVRTELENERGAGPGILVSTANRIAKFVDNVNTTGDSVIAESGGSIGLGTTAPSAKLDVVATVDTQHPLDLTGLNTGTGLGGIYALVSFLNTSTAANTITGFRFQHHNAAAAPRTSAAIESSLSNVTAGAEAGFLVFSTASAGTSSERVRIDSSGNVGIGTPYPNARLHVAGDVSVDGNIAAKYQDVAEWVETTGPTLEPGTVVIVDPVRSNQVVASARAYDTRVAGAVSRQPGLILGERSESAAMVAQSGRVRIKVDARYGAIRIGDLLVTSPTPGHAMRSKPLRLDGQSLHRPGTMLGKALEALPAGKGEILVLLTLQ